MAHSAQIFLASLCLYFLSIPFDSICCYTFKLEDFIYSKNPREVRCFSVKACFEHTINSLNAEFINKKYRNLTNLALVLELNFLLVQIKRVRYIAPDYPLSNEMSDQTQHSDLFHHDHLYALHTGFRHQIHDSFLILTINT